MKKLEALIEQLYQQRHQQQLDTVLPLIGDEGLGKSTLMLQLGAKYIHTRDGELPEPDALLDRICYDRRGFQEMMANSDKQALIMVPDAARILYSMDVAKSEQKQIEKDLMDVRGLEYFILLGFQSWDRIGGEIKERRSKLALKIPRRGLIRGYGRDAMDERIDSGSWPESTLTDKFPPLDGTELWTQYQQLDLEQKRERLAGDGSADVEEVKDRQHRAYALRLVRPWNPNMGMSYREAANHHKYSKDWIGETVRDWKDGKYQGLVDGDTSETAGGKADA
jgi:hypothetical protein